MPPRLQLLSPELPPEKIAVLRRPGGGGGLSLGRPEKPSFKIKFAVRGSASFGAKNRLSESEEEFPTAILASFAGFEEVLIMGKLRTQLGAIHLIPSSPPLNRNAAGLFLFFFLVGVAFEAWTRGKRAAKKEKADGQAWPQVPTSFSLFLEKDL